MHQCDRRAAGRWPIDLSAVLMVVISLTGIALVFFLQRRRKSGVAMVVAVGVLCRLIHRLFVP